jgi:hypothetical protein
MACDLNHPMWSYHERSIAIWPVIRIETQPQWCSKISRDAGARSWARVPCHRELGAKHGSAIEKAVIAACATGQRMGGEEFGYAEAPFRLESPVDSKRLLNTAVIPAHRADSVRP